MADNYVENHHLDYLAQKARRERERLIRLRDYRMAYIRRREQERQQSSPTPHDESAAPSAVQ